MSRAVGTVRAGVLAAILMVGVAAGASAASRPVDPFAECERQVRVAPGSDRGYLCFYESARAARSYAAADERLAGLARDAALGPGGSAWATLARGHVALVAGDARAIDLYRGAADAFARLGEARGEVQSRANLRNLLARSGRRVEAAAEVARATAVAERSGEPFVLTLALVLEASDLMESGRNLGRASRNLERAARLLFPDGPVSQRKNCLVHRARLQFLLGRYDRAIDEYRRLSDLLRTEGDARGLASAAFGWALARERQLEELPEPGGLGEVAGKAREALEHARASGLREIEQRSLQSLGEIAVAEGRSAEGRRLLDDSLRAARELGNPERLASALWSLAEATEGAEAERFGRAASAAALEAGDPRTLVYTWQARMQLDWRLLPRDAAVRSSLLALSEIEALRGLQTEEESRIGLFSAWTRTYRVLVGRVLDAPAPDLDLAFAVMERMRGRFLLESLVASGTVRALAPDHPLRLREQRALAALADVQLRLVDPEPRPKPIGDELSAALTERELELQEATQARRAAEAALAWGDERRVRLGSTSNLDAVRGLLGAGEAMLLFQLGSWRDAYGVPAGGSWLLALSRSGTRSYRLPDRAEIEPTLPIFLGLVARRGAVAPAAARLGGELLGAALRDLPAAVDRLIVVPDGALYNLPWEALRLAPGAEPLGLRYEIAVVPSASLWQYGRSRLAMARATPRPDAKEASRRADPSAAEGRAGRTAARSRALEIRGAFVLADPARFGSSRRAASSRGVAFAEVARLGPLPFARREGRAVARRVPASRLLMGEDASEAALEEGDLAPYQVLHLAAHAVVDDRRPERSAVPLVPGPPGSGGAEDGLLQPHEIAALPLADKLVVLSACRTAAGSVVSGEGPISLARAFFRARAATVIGSRWPLADDEAERLVATFYRELAGGGSAARALRSARREAAAAGLPEAAWASLVLMGEPDWALPEPLRAHPAPVLPWAVAGALAVAAAIGLGLAGAWRRRRAA